MTRENMDLDLSLFRLKIYQSVSLAGLRFQSYINLFLLDPTYGELDTIMCHLVSWGTDVDTSSTVIGIASQQHISNALIKYNKISKNCLRKYNYFMMKSNVFDLFKIKCGVSIFEYDLINSKNQPKVFYMINNFEEMYAILVTHTRLYITYLEYTSIGRSLNTRAINYRLLVDTRFKYFKTFWHTTITCTGNKCNHDVIVSDGLAVIHCLIEEHPNSNVLNIEFRPFILLYKRYTDN
ncbi:hypothetical protein AGLY_001046 [Aphis glycines]|uniref:Uncharacterized protein n=1 Tax=Aphis glycines TaxID=307491 RepID=A0A6G0U977_APHGL|nr:hypothetical protein AGLY_001046 [Aphis glycines]